MENIGQKDGAPFLLADAHCDSVQVMTPWRLAFGSRESHLDFPRLIGRSRLQFMACFLGGDVMSLPPADAWRRLQQQRLDMRFAATLRPEVEVLADLSQAGAGDKVQLVPAIEGLDFLAGDYRRVDDLYELGFRSFGLFWNNDSFLGSGALTPQDKGLTGAGRELVRRLAERGWLVDLAHASEKSFWQVAEILAEYDRPLFVSHSAAAALCAHRRNLTDEQLKAVAQSGGVIGLTLVPQFLCRDGRASAADFARHAAHIAGLIGAEHLALGSDFDGTDELPEEIGGVQDAELLYRAMLAEGLAERDAAAVMGANLLRFLQSL